MLTQAELERAATDAVASWAASSPSATAGGKGPRGVITLASEYPDTDVWRVAAAATTAFLGRGYAKLRSKGVAAPAAAARVETELRNGTVGGALLDALLDGGGGREGHDALPVVRDVFVGTADGDDLHHLDLLLRLMSEAAARSGPSGGAEAGGGIGGGSKNPIERRLNAHVGLMRRLLKAAPPGLDYKALIGEDPLADPLADPAAEGAAAAAAAGAFAGSSSAPSSNSSAGSSGAAAAAAATRRTAAGLAAARARAMAELRSVAGLEHAPALSKLAARIPGMSVSAVYLAVAQRVLCGETGGLSPEATELLRGCLITDSDDEEEAEAASASVYHLLSPLLPKMAAADLVEVAVAVCAPHAAGDHRGYYPCRRTTAAVTSSSPPADNRMTPFGLTVRGKRRVLAAAVAAEGSGSAGVASAAAATLASLSSLLDALDVVSARILVQREVVSRELEMAWAASNRALSRDDSSGAETAALQQQRAVSAAAGAAADLVAMEASPASVDAVCSAMQAALGVRATEAAWAAPVADASANQGAAATELLNPSRVYATAASAILARLVSGDPDDRTRALQALRRVCIAAAAGSGAGDGSYRDAGSAAAAASGKAWGVLAPRLDLFCREGESSFRASDGGGGGGDGNETAPSVVLWARAEVLTLVRSFGGASGTDEEPESATGGGAGEVVEGVTTDNQQHRESHGLLGDGDGGDRRVPSPLPAQLSVPFLRVAELAMEAFGKRTSPEDVDSWASRSAFLGLLVPATTSGATFGRRKNRTLVYVCLCSHLCLCVLSLARSISISRKS